MRKNEQIVIRCTPEQKLDLERQAESRSINLSEFVRGRLFDAVEVGEEDLETLLHLYSVYQGQANNDSSSYRYAEEKKAWDAYSEHCKNLHICPFTVGRRLAWWAHAHQ